MTTENQEPTIELSSEDEPRSNVGRRAMFGVAAGGAVAAAAAIVGASSGGQSAVSPAEAAGSASNSTKRPTRNEPAAKPAPAVPAKRRAKAPTEADLMIGVVAAGLEQLAVNTYGAALDAATSGALGDVPPAVAEFVTVAQQHHQAALDAWNGALTAGGMDAVTAPPADLEASVNSQFGMVTDAGGAAQLALMLEQVAAATYLAALGTLESEEAIALAGSIQPVTRQRVAILLFALGMYPVPETFANTDLAYAGGGMPTPTMPETR